MEIRKIRTIKNEKLDEYNLSNLCYVIREKFNLCGFNCDVDIKNSSKIRVSRIRINTNLWGHNRHAVTGRRGAYLSWTQWTITNNLINAIFDNMKLSANISSLSGTFLIRDGVKSIVEWNNQQYDNVGSLMCPVSRVDVYDECVNMTKNNIMIDECQKVIISIGGI